MNFLKSLLIIAMISGGCFALAAQADPAKISGRAVWGDDFDKAHPNGWPLRWQKEGFKWGVPETDCQIIDGVLRIKCRKSTGGIIILPRISLAKAPIMRWRWRVFSLPKDGDGRIAKKDDQPIAIYLGTSAGMIKKKAISYRWDNHTPKHFEGKSTYAGILAVNYITLRNNKDKLGEWVTEERNVAADFKRLYGKLPKEFAVSIIGNSQYTQSNTVAEIDFIEFLPAK